MAFDKLSCFAVGICVPVLHGALGFIEANAVERPSIDLGDISSRPVAKRVPFERFFQIHNVSSLEFSPDARTLYFLRNDGHVDNVFAIDLVDRRTRQVTAFREPVHRFLVGRRGKYLIIAQDIAGNERYDLYRFDLKTGETLRLTKSGAGDMSFPCDLSPDGAVLYYGKSRDGRSESDLWRLELQTGEKRVILRANERLLECGEASPDGRFLLFREFVENNEKHLGILDLYTGKAHYIMRVPGVNNVDAGFSRGRVYFLNAMGADGFRLWQYQIGAPLPTLAKIPIPHPIESLSFQADGRVVVVRYRDKLASRTEIFVDHFRQSSTFGFAEEDIVGAVFSRAEPKIGVIVAADAVMPPRYFLLTPAGLELLYDSNQSGIEPRHFTKVRSVRIPSFDGLKVPVHLFIPNGTSSKSPRPAIFWIHGGPEEHIDPIFDSQIQFLANRGFIVVAPNVRGSTGFGKQYALLDDGDWGGGHIRDIVEVAGFVRDLDFVDGDKLFIVGESFGGFSVLSLITQYPDVFRAAVDISGMSELATFVDSWPAYVDSYVLRELGFDPRRNATRNLAVSPLYHVDRIRIPLQIHQGLNDRRVPKAQSDRMVEHMRRLGLSVEYHVYEDEGHGFSRFSSEQSAFNKISDFFDRHAR
ncbi:MAG: alpha/beta fold hydrolase [Pseudomonadota bacterium]|nr:alpha/beta fold hydrolase [Pseudomonadota bacterium]